MTGPDNTRTKEDLSRAILETANHLFNKYGVEEVSMHQIAKSAGVGQGTLYRRYSNKADLCIGLMQNNFDHFRSEVTAYLEASAEEAVQVRLKGYLSIIIHFLEQKSKVLGIILSQQLLEKNKDDFFHSAPYQFMHGSYCAILSKADESCLRKPIDPVFLAHSYIAVMSPHTYSYFLNVKGYTKETIYRLFCEMHIDPLFKERNGQ